MTSPAVKKGKKPATGSPSTRQSPRTLANMANVEINSSTDSEEQEQPEQEMPEEVEIRPVYFPPRIAGAPEIALPKDFRYQLILPPLDKRVKEDGNLWRNMHAVKFADYNLGDTKLYPQFRRDRYLTVQRNTRTQRDEFVPMEHVQHLVKPGLLNLLEIPHFGRGPEVNAVVRMLLSCVHGGYLWLSNRIDINVDLIHRITGLSKTGNDPQINIDGATKDTRLNAKQVADYKLERGGRAYDVSSIQDDILKFTVSLLAGKILFKVRPKEVTGSVIRLAIDTIQGKAFNWSLFLMNSFFQDCAQAQENPLHSFHFSWLLILMAFIGWKEPPNSQFPQLEPGACRGAKYSNLWESNNPEKQKNNAMVFHDYYMLLLQTVTTIPRIDSPVVDLYYSRLEFKVDWDKTYIRPKGFRKHKDWAPGPYRMDIKDAEDTIRDCFDDEMKQMFDDLTSGIVLADPAADVPEIDPKDKGKGPLGSKRKGTEGPSPLQTKKKRTKTVTFEEPKVPTITDEEYELLASKIEEKMQAKFAAIQSSQDLLNSNLNKQLTELKTITERTASMQIQSAPGSVGGSSQPPLQVREESIAGDRTNIVRIPAGSIKFPVPMEVQMVQPLEVNLPEVPVDQLYDIFQQIGTELRHRERITYEHNALLSSDNVQLIAQHEEKSAQLNQYVQREQDVSLVLENIAAELPQCDIKPELEITQKIRKIAERAKALDEEKNKMEEEYKAKIAALEENRPLTQEEIQEARVQAIRIVQTQMQSRVEATEAILEDASKTWLELEELPQKKELQQHIRHFEDAIAKAEEEYKGLNALAKMRKKGEITKFQQQVQRYREKEINLANAVSPHENKVAHLVDQLEKKVQSFQSSKGVIESTEDSLVTAEMLTAAQEEVITMDESIKTLKAQFAIISQEATDKLTQMTKADVASGSGASHK